MSATSSRKWLTILTACIAVAAVQAPASATFIEGAIGFGGLFTPTGGTGGDLSDATGIDIGFSQVIAVSGDFTPALGSTAVFDQVDFNPANTPIASFWTVTAGSTTFSFDLLDISLDFQTANEINLSGNGILMANGFDDTPGSWTFSGQQGNIFLTFSSISAAQQVTEPRMVLLLGFGILGLAIARTRTR